MAANAPAARKDTTNSSAKHRPMVPAGQKLRLPAAAYLVRRLFFSVPVCMQHIAIDMEPGNLAIGPLLECE